MNVPLRRWILPVLILPGTALVIVPALILILFRGTPLAHTSATPGAIRFWLALLFFLPGLALAVWTAMLFFRFGQGTPAPWDPPRRFVLRGPYRHVRNPMILGVILILLAEATYFGSWPLLVWCALFIVGNAVYIPLVEEQRLEQRFGAEYTVYKANVPRWLLRRSAWNQGEAGQTSSD